MLRPRPSAGTAASARPVGGGQRHRRRRSASPTTAAWVTDAAAAARAPKVPGRTVRGCRAALSPSGRLGRCSRLAGKSAADGGRAAGRAGVPGSLRGRATVVTPTARQASASSTTSPTVSRARSVRRAGRAAAPHRGLRLEDVADPAHRVDHRGAPGVDLLPQVADVELDDMRLAAEVVGPDPVEDLGLGQHPAGVAHQEPQQLELGAATAPPARPPRRHLPGVLVHDEVPDGQPVVVPGPRAMPARRSSPRSRASTSSRLNGLVT